MFDALNALFQTQSLLALLIPVGVGLAGMFLLNKVI